MDKAMRIIAGICIAGTPAAGLRAAETAPATDLLRTLTGLDPQGAAVPLRLILLVTILGVVPSVVLLTTCFPRILIVLSFLRRALGTQDLPSNQVLAGLTLILTAWIMMPVWKRIHDEAYVPLQAGQLKSTDEALERAAGIMKGFMLAHTLERDLRLFVDLSRKSGEAGDSVEGVSPEATVESLSFFVVLPAYVLSELKTAFQMGFLLYLPFLVIDLAVSAVLISMGMFFLPPVLVSLPLKVLVFVLADGWNLVVEQLIQGFRVLH